jgi:HlyD family secretion protein
MTHKILILLFLASLITSCKNDEKQSDAFGNFEADKTFISAEAMGKILEFRIEEGDIIKKDEIVGQIDTLDLYYKKLQLKSQIEAVAANFIEINSQLEVQKQQLENIEIQKNRTAKLHKEKAATQQQLDNINGQYNIAEKQIVAIESKRNALNKQIEAMRNQLKEIELNISKCTIVNPVTGSILNKLAMKGEMAMPGKPLYSLADLTYLNLKAYISGSQLSKIKLGEKINVIIDGPDNSLLEKEGKLIWISSSSEFTPKTIQTREERVNLVYAIKVRVENGDGSLKIGMPGELVFNN